MLPLQDRCHFGRKSRQGLYKLWNRFLEMVEMLTEGPKRRLYILFTILDKDKGLVVPERKFGPILFRLALLLPQFLRIAVECARGKGCESVKVVFGPCCRQEFAFWWWDLLVDEVKECILIGAGGGGGGGSMACMITGVE